MARNVIYYGFAMPPVTGGDFVSLDHVAALRRMGFDARVFYGASDDGHLRFLVPADRLPQLRHDDIMVLGETYSWEAARAVPTIKVMHNQNPFLTFYGIGSVQALNAYPVEHILVPSDFCASRLCELGVNKKIHRVRPALPDYFAPRPKKLRIAYAPSKRQREALYLKGYFQSIAPEYAGMDWIALQDMTREGCAQAMAEAAVYAALPYLESLGLMNLEAMASGCHVVGFTGYGGEEYANPDNGDWIAEGGYGDFVHKLRAACRLFESGAANVRIAAGRATASLFNRANFIRELESAWTAILGDKAWLYRL